MPTRYLYRKLASKCNFANVCEEFFDFGILLTQLNAFSVKATKPES